MGCCKNVIASLVCTAVLCGAGVAAYMYGPWNKDNDSGSEETTTTLTAKSSTCKNCCNGLESNCDLPIDQVTWAMVHNAMSSEDDFFYAANNDLSLEKALVEGYRGLMLDSCLCNGDTIVDVIQDFVTGNDEDTEENTEEQYLGFCHGTCGAGSRKPETVLNNIKTFLDVNPNEVLILEFEVGEGTLELLYEAINDSGLEKYVLRDEENDGTVTTWPTLQQLISSNRRLLLFAHNGGMESCATSTCPEGIFYTYDHFSQTNWNDGDTCELRGSVDTIPDKHGFFLMNHWKNDENLDLPSKTNAEEFNTYEFLSTRLGKCDERVPNIVAVDFWSTGDVLKFVEDQNTKIGGGGDAVVAASRSGSIRH
mmetsp:Transcript_12021/g.24257  ORF Transcript_12021/g.24257 Transcript_12021/m.24257 type:complete len:366 (+) Transcript_12021:114-1211(+)